MAQTLGDAARPARLAGAAHVPQYSVPPHPSGTVPQFFPSRPQVYGRHAGLAADVGRRRLRRTSGPRGTCRSPASRRTRPARAAALAQRVTRGRQAARGAAHVGHAAAAARLGPRGTRRTSSVPPHPSGEGAAVLPQGRAGGGQARGRGRTRWGAPPPHVSPSGQVPHVEHARRSRPVRGRSPSPSADTWRGYTAARRRRWARRRRRTLVPAGHAPHSSVPPQPLETGAAVLRLAPRRWWAGTRPRPQTLGAPPPPHVSPSEQVPHSSVPPHPSGTVPHVLPQRRAGGGRAGRPGRRRGARRRRRTSPAPRRCRTRACRRTRPVPCRSSPQRAAGGWRARAAGRTRWAPLSPRTPRPRRRCRSAAMPPQPSMVTPQSRPSEAHVSGWHAPRPRVSGASGSVAPHAPPAGRADTRGPPRPTSRPHSPSFTRPPPLSPARGETSGRFPRTRGSAPGPGGWSVNGAACSPGRTGRHGCRHRIAREHRFRQARGGATLPWAGCQRGGGSG